MIQTINITLHGAVKVYYVYSLINIIKISVDLPLYLIINICVKSVDELNEVDIWQNSIAHSFLIIEQNDFWKKLTCMVIEWYQCQWKCSMVADYPYGLVSKVIIIIMVRGSILKTDLIIFKTCPWSALDSNQFGTPTEYCAKL